ncbi:FAD-binding oxidoreductase [Agilicoccus flavus]|uniref:FAD-binding oxidoreductase n=1 Tax=Agilicoccus flavus TaxID=2775968 RepID=UPI001CF6F150|nr:FAD-linked oxidase C-terminal domain-containing protein [Agilicoccus flavus]
MSESPNSPTDTVRDEAVVAALREALPADAIIALDDDVMAAYAHDEGEWVPFGRPAAVVRPATAEQVQAVVRVCLDLGVPVVPRGAGTGLCGGANAIDGCVVVSLARMDAVLEIDPVESIAVVQPGVINDDLRAAAAARGLWYPPDPASAPWSTIGGNVATNAGGVCCVKYGVTRDYVIGLQIVTGTGELVRVGRRTAKGVAGYDFVGLLVGSEGTLGIVTEVTVKLRSARAPETTVAGYFDSLVAAGRGVAAVAEAGITPSALELLDRHCLEAVDAWKNMGLSAEADVVLLARTDLPGEAGVAEAQAIAAAFDAGGATFSVVAEDAEEADALFAARRLAYPALERLGPVLTEDVCVPRARVSEMLGRIETAGAAHGVHIANIAHAGDGNLHPLLIVPAGDEAAKAAAHRAFDDIIAAALELGGTVAGEHGIGLLKRGGLADEVDPAVMDLHRAVKTALDPHGILNPGKVVA